MKKNNTKWIILAIIGVLVLFSVSFFNKMVTLEEDVKGQWANVESVYQRRADLIPNLVNTVKGYAAHEKETLEAVINARAKATSVNLSADNLTPEGIQQFQQAQSGFSSALGKLMVVVEKYPDLKANQNFRDLQAQLEGTENRINVERRSFNEKVQKYNSKIRKFPGVLFAGIYGFDEKGYFEAEKGSEKAPEVNF